MRTSRLVAPVAALAALALTAGVLGACSSDDEPSAETSAPAPPTSAVGTTPAPAQTTAAGATTTSPAAPTTPPTTTSAPTTTVAPVVPLADVAVAVTEVTQFDSPIVMVGRADGRLYVGERGGTVRLFDDESNEVVLDIGDRTTTDSERGLLGLALSPDETRLYVSSTDNSGDSVIEEYLLDAAGVVDTATRRVVLQVEQPYRNHNGGHIEFGPDGYLYVGMGDGGSGGDPERRALDGTTLLGKLLRIDPATASGDVGYTVPADNPFVGVEGVRPEIWSNGLRNPWRFSFDSLTGDLWIGDVGQGALEEVDLALAADGGGRGVSFGWSAYEGTARFNGDQPADGHVPPVHEYRHGNDGCSIVGGIVSRGERLPGLAGAYVFGDYCSGRIWAMRVDGGVVTEHVHLAEVDSLVSFAEDAFGDLYAISLDGPVYRLDPT